MEIRLDNKVALVTGASSGIGLAIAQALAACGAKVCINYRADAAEAARAVDAITSAGGSAFAVQADVSDQAQVSAMFAQLESRWVKADILVNCAGTDGKAALSWEADAAEWKKVIEVNLFGAFYCAQQALLGMTKKKSGVIVNITSVHETIAWTGYSAYTSSKAALSMLTKTLAQEAAPFGVRVLAVAPGAIQTDINKAVWSNPASLHDLQHKIPLARMGQTREIADMVAVLVSDTGSYITGTTVFIDGGMTDYPDFAQGG
ncbi:3-oxoacyl-ACP reductase FabG [Undibacterium terreum]|uniref:Glucose-1-dehydrogenase n=1 Tax=Undibacterium terreum TaxID=1224302 RepID=A0A916XER4_9BURK|nr:3-oxoacyl-ACP reductase FabG [Undibacterium terreum]GGC66521.1 glucose-1-dehydrogenase [Undibacterium terreum]